MSSQKDELKLIFLRFVSLINGFHDISMKLSPKDCFFRIFLIVDGLNSAFLYFFHLFMGF